MILKLSHNLMPELDMHHCSPELLERYLQMLRAAGLFEGSLSPGTEVEIAQSLIRVLLAAVAIEDKEVGGGGGTVLLVDHILGCAGCALGSRGLHSAFISLNREG